jgi:hypothetical protein
VGATSDACRGGDSFTLSSGGNGHAPHVGSVDFRVGETSRAGVELVQGARNGMRVDHAEETTMKALPSLHNIRHRISNLSHNAWCSVSAAAGHLHPGRWRERHDTRVDADSTRPDWWRRRH